MARAPIVVYGLALLCSANWCNADEQDCPAATGGQALRADRPGVVFSTTGEAELVRVGATLFRDRRYQVKQWPPELGSAIYLRDTIGGEKSLRVIRPGMVYFLTPLPHRNPRGSQSDRLQRQGFQRVAVPEVELFEFTRAAETYCALYQKECTAGEVVEFGLWAVPVMMEEARTAAQDAQPKPGRETVMVAGREHPVPIVHQNPGPEYADANRRFGIASSIARTPGGRLWCGFSSGGEMEGQDNFGVVVYSDDDGQTWSEPFLVLDQDGPGGIRTDHVTVWTAPNGSLWIMWSEYPLGLTQPHSSQWAITSDDADAARPEWSPPRKLADQLNLLTTPTVLSDGWYILPTGNWQRDENNSRPLISTDSGRSFQLGGELTSEIQNDFDEYMVVERSDGRLISFNRLNGSFLIGESSDRGRTWTTQRPNEIPHPAARFVFMKLRSANWLLVKHGPIDTLTGRVQLMAYLSRNEGTTWEGGLMLDDRSCSYPFGFQSDDGTIYVSYERQRWVQPEILLARFTEEDILAGKPVSNRAALKLLVNKAGGIARSPHNLRQWPLRTAQP
jgi:hypothetical protein